MSKKAKKSKPIKKKVVVKNVVNTTGIIPLGDRVLIRPFQAEEIETKNSFGIIIPETVKKEKPEQGEVVAVGGGKMENGKLVAVSVSVGDKVVFSRFGYEDVIVGDVEYYILKEENILAIIK